MDAAITIRRYDDVRHEDALAGGLDAIFFEASNTKSFADPLLRAAFRERWLGRYLRYDPQFAYVALAADRTVAGYVVGSIEDPARAERFSGIATFATFSALTARYPAHLHVNVAPQFRSHGLGAALVGRFIADAKAAGASGVHITTGRGARNVAFYARIGFSEVGATGAGAREIVFLARAL